MATKWRHCCWGDLAILEYGKGLRDYKRASGSYRVFGTNGPIGWHSKPLCNHPTVVVGRKGAYRGIHFSPSPCLVIDTAFYLSPKSDLDMRWAYYELLTHDINALDSGSAIPSTSRDSFYRLSVCLPPLSEQRAIAHILGTLDDKIEMNRRMNETLEAMAQAFFKSWFVDFDPVRAKLALSRAEGAEGRLPAAPGLAQAGDPGLPKPIADLFPADFQDSKLGRTPKGWEVGTIGQDFNLTMGQSPPGTTYNELGEGMPFFQGRTDFGIRYPSRRVFCTAPTRVANPGDTLVSVRAPVGDINMAMEKCCIGRGVAAVRHMSGSRSYTYYIMRSLADVFRGFEADGTVFGCVNKDDFQRIKFTTPPPQLVLEFEKTAFPADQTIENQIMQSQTLAAIRDALLPKLLSGDIRVKVAEKLVGEAAI